MRQPLDRVIQTRIIGQIKTGAKFENEIIIGDRIINFWTNEKLGIGTNTKCPVSSMLLCPITSS